MWALGDKVASSIIAQSIDIPTLPWSGSGKTLSDLSIKQHYIMSYCCTSKDYYYHYYYIIMYEYWLRYYSFPAGIKLDPSSFGENGQLTSVPEDKFDEACVDDVIKGLAVCICIVVTKKRFRNNVMFATITLSAQT